MLDTQGRHRTVLAAVSRDSLSTWPANPPCSVLVNHTERWLRREEPSGQWTTPQPPPQRLSPLTPGHPNQGPAAFAPVSPSCRVGLTASPGTSTTVVKTNETQACTRAVVSRATPLGRVGGKKPAVTAGVGATTRTSVWGRREVSCARGTSQVLTPKGRNGCWKAQPRSLRVVYIERKPRHSGPPRLVHGHVGKGIRTYVLS